MSYSSKKVKKQLSNRQYAGLAVASKVGVNGGYFGIAEEEGRVEEKVSVLDLEIFTNYDASDAFTQKVLQLKARGHNQSRTLSGFKNHGEINIDTSYSAFRQREHLRRSSSSSGSSQTVDMELWDLDDEDEDAEADLYNDEHLRGDDFLSTPWLPPSIDKALEYKKKTIFKGGSASFFAVSMSSTKHLGRGTALFFSFTYAFSLCFFFMSLCTLPGLYFYHSGSRIDQKDQDALGIYRFSLGNLGFSSTSLSYHSDFTCLSSPSSSSSSSSSSSFLSSPQSSNSNATILCITLSNGTQLPLVTVANYLAFFEILQCLIFLATVLYLYLLVHSAQKDSSLSVSDYSIMVTSLPVANPTASPPVLFPSIPLLLDHFSTLYQLERPDWRGRPGVALATPVHIVDNTQDEVHRNTWVAELIVHKGEREGME